jgi:hypothetical protein
LEDEVFASFAGGGDVDAVGILLAKLAAFDAIDDGNDGEFVPIVRFG